ncbi:MAG: adenylate/guanylate cyclase domain-containing protein [Hydrogenothermaceae bacterium]|nr:adenylate/guanylate cyclase domain-containing protein [Hydrogenothermaceae bacterium]
MKFRSVYLIFLLSILITLIFYLSPMLDWLETKSFDMRVKLTLSTQKAPEEVVIILIDEPTLKMMDSLYGRWPWPREIHGDVIKFLSLGGAKAVVYDILFTEKSEQYQDSILAEATKEAGNVYHAIQLYLDSEVKTLKPLPTEIVSNFSLKKVHVDTELPTTNEYMVPYRDLYISSKGLGVVEFSPDKDGVYRKTHLIRRYGKMFFPILPLSILISDKKVNRIVYSKDSCLISGENYILSVPLLNGEYVVKLYGSYNVYSMSGIIASIMAIKKGYMENIHVDPSEFSGKVVFVGASSIGLEDLKPTSLFTLTPGVFLHASIYSNIIKEDFFNFVKPMHILLVSIVVVSLINLIFFLNMRFMVKVLVSLYFVFFWLFIAFGLFYKNIVVDLVKPIVSFTSVIVLMVSYTSIKEEREKRKIKKSFEKYVSTATIQHILNKPEEAILDTKGKRIELSILFSDIRGFTRITESSEPEKIVEMLNIYLDSMTEVVFRNSGTVDKFIGDAILAFWGAPIKTENHPYLAVKSALEMLSVLNREVNPFLSRLGLPQISIGIGINTADVVLGNIGSKYRLDYTVIGDGVNLASRLESLTRFYDVNILISEYTCKKLNAKEKEFSVKVIDLVRVKGKKEPVTIYEVTEYSALNEKIAELTEKAFQLYLKGRWEESSIQYRDILEIVPTDTVSKIFLNRCKVLLAEKPSGWDGVWEFKEK